MVREKLAWPQSYSKYREANIDFAKILIKVAHLTKTSKVLEIGSGTGNYCRLIQRLSGAKIIGIDPSKGMVKEARKKSKKILFREGTSTKLLFKDNSFDFVFYFDVIHHIKNMTKSFYEAFRVLKKGGFICIITNSRKQIKERFSTNYFPSTTLIDLKRYYLIYYLRKKLLSTNFKKTQVLHIVAKRKRLINKKYYLLTKNKAYSVFYKISEKEFRRGLERLKRDLNKGLRFPLERTFIFAEK